MKIKLIRGIWNQTSHSYFSVQDNLDQHVEETDSRLVVRF